MSIPVDLAALPEQITRSGPNALLVTTTSDGPPHISSVVVTIEENRLSMRVGNRTRTNAADHPAVALVWTTGVDDGYCLIVDAMASECPATAETLVVTPCSAVLHRLAR